MARTQDRHAREDHEQRVAQRRARRRAERVAEALRRNPIPPVFVVHMEGHGGAEHQAGLHAGPSTSGGARLAGRRAEREPEEISRPVDMYVLDPKTQRWVRRRVERFPNEGAARAARDIDSGRFRMVSTDAMHAESGGVIGHSGGVFPPPPPTLPPQPVRTGMRSRLIRRMNANWGRDAGRHAPVREPPGPWETSSSETESSGEDGPGRFR